MARRLFRILRLSTKVNFVRNGHQLKLDITLGNINDIDGGSRDANPRRMSNVDSSLTFVTREHADLDVGTAELLDRLGDPVLQLVLDS